MGVRSKRNGTAARRAWVCSANMAAVLVAGTLLWASSGWAQTHLQLEGTLAEDPETRLVGETDTSVDLTGAGDNNVTIEQGTDEPRTYTVDTTTNYGTVQSMGVVSGEVTIELKDWNTDLEPNKEPLTIITSCGDNAVLETPGLSETDRVKMALVCCSPGFADSDYFKDCPTGIQVTEFADRDKAVAGIVLSLNRPSGERCHVPDCKGAIVELTCEGTNEKQSYEVTESETAGTSCTAVYREINGNIDSDFQSAAIDLDAFFDVILAQFADFLTDLLTAIGGFLDLIPPVLETSGDQTVERVLPGGARVVFKAASRDVDIFGNSVDIFGNVIGDPSPLVECKDQNGTVRHSGDVFAEGTWTITCSTWDHKYDLLQDLYVLGNESSPKSFTITVTPVLLPGRSVKIKPGKLTKFVAKPVKGSGDVVLPSADPVISGGELRVFDTGSTAGDDTYPLFGGGTPPLGWKALGDPPGSKGYKYKGTGLAGDPCKVVVVKKKVIAGVCKGPAIALQPPFAGDVGIILSFGTAGRYCVRFGGEEVKNDATATKQKNAPEPAACP